MINDPLALEVASQLIQERLNDAAREALAQEAVRVRACAADPECTKQPQYERWIPAWSSR